MTQLSLFPDLVMADQTKSTPLTLREQPAFRVTTDSGACNGAELLAGLIGGPSAPQLAQTLLNQYGSLHGVAQAGVADLVRVKGVGSTTATRLCATLEISRRLLQPATERVTIRSPADAVSLLQPLLMHREQEYIYVLPLDTRGRVMLAPREVYHGALNHIQLRLGELFREAIRLNAAGLIVAHNHPSGLPEPSPEDVAVTRSAVEAGKLLDVEVLDHLVIGQASWVSMKERGLGF